MKQLSESVIVRKLAENISLRLTRKVVADLQKMNFTLSGDSPLKTVWDDLCVQVQHDKSVFWIEYRTQAESMLSGYLEKLSVHELEALWLQTPEAAKWTSDDESEREPYPVCNDEVTRFLFYNYICTKAETWSNRRIRRYLDY